jgi:hypothetical protein
VAKENGSNYLDNPGMKHVFIRIVEMMNNFLRTLDVKHTSKTQVCRYLHSDPASGRGAMVGG